MGPIEAVTQNTRVESTERSPVHAGLLSEKLEFSSVDDDFARWKPARRPNFAILWRPLCLLATLFFGIASFALPDSVNDIAQWFLYALAAASFWAGFRRRHAKI
jgi:hypothetical protein